MGLKHIIIGLCFSLTTMPAWADCADPPGPGVDWRRCVFQQRDFTKSNLSNAQLTYGRYLRSIFKDSNMTAIDARRAKFIEVNLQSVNLENARLTGTDFTKANLMNASLKGADLRSVQFQQANLRGADLTNARLRGTQFRDADLTGATWTDGKTKCGPGSIGQCR